jgi:hypothetical protein
MQISTPKKKNINRTLNTQNKHQRAYQNQKVTEDLALASSEGNEGRDGVCTLFGLRKS